MNQDLRAQSRARLAEIETRLLAIERHLEAGHGRDALEEICDVRAQINALFAALLAAHLREQSSASPQQLREFEALLRQIMGRV